MKPFFMRYRLCLLLSISFAVCATTAYASPPGKKEFNRKIPWAEIDIRGTVADQNGSPLPGVTITVKGTSKTSISNSDGSFQIRADENATLVFSSVGFGTQEVAVGGRSTVQVTLTATAVGMNEVVVIGYQSVRKKDLTGAVGIINPANATRNTANTLAEAIQGLAAGVTVRNSGAPGAGAKIDIRGTGTFGGNNPLYVIDGMLSDATPDFNTDDIETIQILKDASAAAIYGSRAANGVIIITTKRGKEGPMRIGGNIRTGVQQFHKRWDLMNATDYAALNRTIYQNAGKTPQTSVTTEFDPNVNTDWQELLMRTGNTQDYDISLSGGGNSASYFISGNYYKNKGPIIDNSFEKGGIRVNTQAQRGRFRFGENLLLSVTHLDPTEGDIFTDMLRMLPVMPAQGQRYVSPQNPEGWAVGDPVYANTFATNVHALQSLNQRDYNSYKIRGNAFIEFRLLDWLSYKFNTGLEMSFDYFKGFRKPGVVRQGTPNVEATLSEDRGMFQSTLFEHTLNFDKEFGNHRISAVVGISNQLFKTDGLNTQKIGIPSYSGIYYTVPQQSGTPSVSGGIAEWANLGYLGRVNYSFNDKYLISATVRRDGDSRFGENFRWGTFPSISGAWRIDREEFMDLGWLNELKLRASYGKLGNSEVLRPYATAGNISPLPRYVFGVGEVIAPGATNIVLANRNLHWESKKTTNIGLDATIFKGLSFSIDYFIAKSYDVITYDIPLPLTSGSFGNPAVNGATLENKGIEFTATYRQSNSPLKWDITLNLTHIKNKVTSLGQAGIGKTYVQLGDARTQIGQPIGEWFVLKTNGIFQSQAEIDNYKNKNGEMLQPWAKPGDIRYVDVDEDGEINIDKDRAYAGTPWPKMEAGLVWNGSIKNFSFGIQLYGVAGNKLYNRPRYWLDRMDENASYRAGVQPWTAANPTDFPRAAFGNPDQGIQFNTLPQTDRWLESGSYLRLRNLELGYTIGTAALDRIGFKSARVYVSGQNLLTFTKYTGLDPDITGVNIYERGLDAGQYPALRIYSVGLQFGF